MRVCTRLTDNDVLNLREAGQHRSRVEQALMILSVAYPDLSREQLVALSIGERDARLMAVREHTFGTTLDVFTTCPSCQQALELSLATTNLSFPAPAETGHAGHAYSAVIDDVTVRYRLPDSTDLEAVATCKNVTQAQQRLLDRCVLEIQGVTGNVPGDVAGDVQGKQGRAAAQHEAFFSPAFVAALARQMAKQEPQAEVLLNLQCVECQHEWQSLFDIASFFWSELETHAKRLLSEIYILARTYHWREQDILALPPVRRRWYLEMATT